MTAWLGGCDVGRRMAGPLIGHCTPPATAQEFARYNGRRCRSRWARRRSLTPGSGDRAAPYTVPVKAVQQQCCTSGASPSSTFGSSPRLLMPRSARLFLCARCRDQVLLCSHCDHGQLYCGRTCSAAARQDRRRETAQRYQRSRGGRLKHAARSACWRTRQGSRCQVDTGDDANKVTHQGCPHSHGGASLVACDTPSPIELCVPTAAVTGDAPAPAPEPAAVVAVLVCRRCTHALLPFVRLERLRRRSVVQRSRHDHSS